MMSCDVILSPIQVSPRGPTNTKDPFFWREPIIPGRGECEVYAPPFPPTPVRRDTITVIGVEFGQQAEKLDFNVTWEAPTYLNGDLDVYELCLGREVVGEQESCTLPSTRLCVSGRESATDPDCSPLEELPSGLLLKDIEYALEANGTGVFIQV